MDIDKKISDIIKHDADLNNMIKSEHVFVVRG